MNLWAQKKNGNNNNSSHSSFKLFTSWFLFNKQNYNLQMNAINKFKFKYFRTFHLFLLCVVYTDLKLYYQCEIEQKMKRTTRKKVIFVHYMNLLDFYGVSTTNLCDKHILYMHIFNLRILATAYAYYSLCSLLVCSVYVYAQI